MNSVSVRQREERVGGRMGVDVEQLTPGDGEGEGPGTER